MIDKYFKKPIFWDYCFSTIVILVVLFLQHKNIIAMAKRRIFILHHFRPLHSFSHNGRVYIDFGNCVNLFKSSGKVNKDNVKETDSVFDIFFASRLYFETIKHLKNGIKSLTFIALLGYTLKLTVSHVNYEYLFLFCFMGLSIILMTVGRSLLILSSIIKIQQT